MEFFKKRGVALAVLVIAIAGAVFIGQSRKDSFIANKPTELLDVAYQNWICDDADLLSDQTEQLIRDYNGSWNGKYYAITAVATIDHLAGWDGQDYTAKLAEGLAAKKAVVPTLSGKYETGLIEKLSGLADQIDAAAGELEAALDGYHKIDDVTESANMVRDVLLPKMEALRKPCDEAEQRTAVGCWPFPTYGDLLFGVQ